MRNRLAFTEDLTPFQGSPIEPGQTCWIPHHPGQYVTSRRLALRSLRGDRRAQLLLAAGELAQWGYVRVSYDPDLHGLDIVGMMAPQQTLTAHFAHPGSLLATVGPALNIHARTYLFVDPTQPNQDVPAELEVHRAAFAWRLNPEDGLEVSELVGQSLVEAHVEIRNCADLGAAWGYDPSNPELDRYWRADLTRFWDDPAGVRGTVRQVMVYPGHGPWRAGSGCVVDGLQLVDGPAAPYEQVKAWGEVGAPAL